MSFTVQFKFQVHLDDTVNEYYARELAIVKAKKTFGEVLFKELTGPDIFED